VEPETAVALSSSWSWGMVAGRSPVAHAVDAFAAVGRQSSTVARPIVQNISHYHSKDSHREDNTYHPSLSPQQTTEALVESAVARHHTRVDVLLKNASPYCLQKQDIDPGVMSRHRAFHQSFGGLLWASNFRVSSYGGFLEAVVGGSPSANTNNPGLLRLVEGLVFPRGNHHN
jgi:hypothetical protein